MVRDRRGPMMRNVRLLVAVLGLACSFAPHRANAQEGGFQPPINLDPLIPIPTGQAGHPGFHTSLPEFVFGRLGRCSVFNTPPRPARPPQPGEHLGEYLIAERLPCQTLPAIAEARLPETITPLPPYQEPLRIRLSGGWCPLGPIHPPLGALPPKPGEGFGEYTVASELPARQPAPLEPQRPSLPASDATAAILKSRGVPIVPWANGIAPPGAVPLLPKTPDNRTSINFTEPSGMKVTWLLPDGTFTEGASTLTTPKEYNFTQGKTYRLRLTRVTKDSPGDAFYPTIEIAPATPKTQVFLAHSSVPVTFTADDFEQAKTGQLVVKAIYLPDPAHQDFSTVISAEEVVSARLEPGVDPVKEAARRGTILAVIRLGNVDLEERARPRSEER
jgi:hypothetical protein